MSTYAIGDLQGCYDPFRKLLDKLKFDPSKDTLWLTGDLVNRGPKSLKSIRFVKSLGDTAITVLGNHDLHLLALAHDVNYSDERYNSLWKILGADDGDELLDWLRSRPLAHYSKELNTLMVHAGIPPQWTVKKTLRRAAEVESVLRGDDYYKFLKRMYGDRPNRWSGKLRGNPRLRVIVNSLTRMRMIYHDGRLNFTHNGPPANARKGLVPWFDIEEAKWRGTRIVFGHWSALGLIIRPQLIALDTGCVWGRQLTAVRLNKSPKVISVNCK
jgi:bis(5'-nucleosyl)-tetraphosphatase (symmetrical)